MYRIVISAVAGLIVCVAPALAVESHARSTTECLSMTGRARIASYRRCVSSNTLAKRFADCFGPGRSCIRACQKTRDACESAPNATVQTCQSDSTNPPSCASQLAAALLGCTTDPDPFQCAITARLANVTCNQACFTAEARTIETCVQTAADCEGRCPVK